MIREHRVFSGNHIELLTWRFVLHPFPRTFGYQDKWPLSDYINALLPVVGSAIRFVGEHERANPLK